MLFTVIFEHIWQNASMGRLGMWIRSARSTALQYLIQAILQSLMSQELIILCNMEYKYFPRDIIFFPYLVIMIKLWIQRGSIEWRPSFVRTNCFSGGIVTSFNNFIKESAKFHR